MSSLLPPSPQTASPAWRAWVTAPWIVLLARLLVGGLFMLAGFSKLLLPHAEVVQLMTQYQVIPSWAIPILAASLPWLEVLSGTALLLGFFTTTAALLIGVQLLSFSGLMLVILGKGIAVEDCGCFGNLGLHETPSQVLGRDLLMLGMLLPILWRQQDRWGLDAQAQPSVEHPEIP